MSTASGAQAVGELVKKHSTGKYVKLQNDGDSIVVAFVGDEFAWEAVWTGGRTEFFDEKKHKNLSPSLKVTWNVYVPETGKMMILPVNPTTYQKIITCRDKYGLAFKLYEIKRSGSKGDTNTTYSVMVDADLSKDQRADIDQLDRFDLAADARNAGKGDNTSNESEAVETKPEPISDADATALIARMRPLPKEAVDKFLSRFGISRIRDLDSARLAEADTFVSELAGNGAATGERDPFG
jgi:hypothetical protein